MALFPMARLTILAAMLAATAGARAEEHWLDDGAYDVTYRLELPNVQLWGSEKSATICLPMPGRALDTPFPVLSDNNPFSRCSAVNLRRDHSSLTFAIRCEGRDAARASARYVLRPGGFEGRIAMVMGGKNMTMTEVQIGRRIGSCRLNSTMR